MLDINSTDINGARMLGIIADILDNNSNSTDVRVKLATIQLRIWGIHPGQRDGDGLPVTPPHDENCTICAAKEWLQ